MTFRNILGVAALIFGVRLTVDGQPYLGGACLGLFFSTLDQMWLRYFPPKEPKP